MKRFLLLWVFISMVLVAFAQGQASRNDANGQEQREPSTHVTAAQAMDVGYAFMHTGSGSRSGGTQSNAVRKQNMQLIYTGKATDSLTRTTVDCYYVFALQPKGFVIVAADNRVEPILGYSYDNNFVVENMPEHVRGWLGDYEKQIQLVTKSDQQAEPDIKTKWSRLKSGQPLSNTRNGNSVGPLITTQWDQEYPYNILCPEDSNCSDGHVATGCVATAMAQIINYWGYPAHGRGTHSYSSYYGTLTVNYDSAYYDYANMPDALTSSSTQEEINAVVKLMYHCGVALNMGYETGGSGALNADARAAFVDQFRYSPQMGFADRELYGNTEWIAMIQNEISNGRPVFYGGVSDYTSGPIGHAFVCDGYDENDFFHFNFGWSGNGDGWYLISNINPGIYNFQSQQAAIMGIEPDSLSNTLYSLVGLMSGGYTQYVIDSSFFFSNELYDNPYRSISADVANVNIVSFYPADTTKQLVLDYMLFSESPYNLGEISQYVYIYDGIPGSYVRSDGFIDYILPDSLMRQYVESENNLDHSPVVSTKHGLTLVIRNRYLTDQDFHFRISYDEGCRLVTDIATSVDTNTINLHWHEHGTANQWQVEYGTKGFLHGEGVLLTINDTNASLADLVSFREYDIYVRPLCDTINNESWSEAVTVMPEARYWTDVVTSQPEGYEEDSLGNVYISTAEGLAWLAKLSWENAYDPDPRFFVGHKAFLTADINLGRYKWKSIYYFCGEFDGQGHSIDSMYAIERDYEGTSLFISTQYSTIKNIYLLNCYSKQLQIQEAAGLTRGGGVIMNCYVSGEIEGHGTVAAVATGGSLIINCASNCKVIGHGSYVGGITTLADKVRNCYSASTITGWSQNKFPVGGDENCYAYMPRNGHLVINSYSSVTMFDELDNGFYLIEPVFFEPDSQYYSNLKDVLNAGVRKFNLEGLRLWVDDTAGINEGMPILGPEYVVTCPNIQNLSARNIVDANGEYGVELSWTEEGDATSWEIKYHRQDFTNDTCILVTNYSDTLWNLSEQTTYLFSVRPVCGSVNRGGWSDEFALVVDRPYWTEMVTTQPDGYSVDEEGNVNVYTAEGLAWLVSVVNGLNGQTADDFEDKTVTLMQDINIGQFKWTAINDFRGVFDGDGHTIRGLYVNELANNQGLFGIVYGGRYMNVFLDSADVKGRDRVGILIGLAEPTYNMKPLASIVNCHVSGTVYGDFYVGGIAGTVNGEEINACSSSGTVLGNNTIGGLFGYATLLRFDGANYYGFGGSMRNCFSSCDIFYLRPFTGFGVGGLAGSVSLSMENCYAIGNVNGWVGVGGLVGYLYESSYGNSMRNCYSASIVSHPLYSLISRGAIIGSTTSSPVISNCYGLADYQNHLLIGLSDDGSYPIVSDTASFIVENDSIVLLNSVKVEQTYFDNILDVLNAWVDTYDTVGAFLHWVADTTGENGGFPMFEEIKYHTVTLFAAESTPYGSFRGAGSHANYEPTIITAIPDYGYHFVQWNDGNTDNPRTIKLTQDTAFTAIFEKNMFTIIGTAGDGMDYSFDFENPARDYLWTLQNGDYVDKWWITTLDDTNRALFISNSNGYGNQFTIQNNSIVSAYTALTLSSGQYSYSYDYHNGSGNNMTIALIPVIEQQTFDELTIFNLPDDAILFGISITNEWTHRSGQIYVPATGEYIFGVFWADGACCSGTKPASAIDNIRIYKIPEEEDNHGFVFGSDIVPYLDTVILTAVPNEGYYFSHWHDGNMDNPRTVVAHADKYHVAIFEECIPNIVNDSVVACDICVWRDSVYTVSTIVIDTLPTQTGCDSMVIHHLVINHATNLSFMVDTCDWYMWNGETYTTSGTYYCTHTDNNNCTQVDTLYLTIHNSEHTAIEETTCDSYTWNGATYTESGDYTQAFTAANGCDSIVNLHLTITVGIGNYDLANVMKLYPNPTKDVVNVQLTMNNEQLEGVSIQLFDVYGRLLEVINMADAHGASPQTPQIDLSRYAKGVYFVKAVSEGKIIAVRKVVKN